MYIYVSRESVKCVSLRQLQKFDRLKTTIYIVTLYKSTLQPRKTYFVDHEHFFSCNNNKKRWQKGAIIKYSNHGSLPFLRVKVYDKSPKNVYKMHKN